MNVDEFLFGNVGIKIKNWAKGLFWFEVAAVCLYAIISAFLIHPLYLLFVLLSFPVAWVSNIILYAFGDICENLQKIAENSGELSGTHQKKSDELPDL